MNTNAVLAELRRQVAKHGQTAVAKDIGVSRSYICHMLAKRRLPTMKIANGLGFRFVIPADRR